MPTPDSTDPTTERMQRETGHDCIACPSDVRNLYAAAHNALAQWESDRSASRMFRKMESLRRAVETVKISVDEHFETLNAWRRP